MGLHLMFGGLVPVLICGFPGPLMAFAPQTNVIYKLSLPTTKQLIRPDLTSTQIYKGPLLYSDQSIGLQNMNTAVLTKAILYQIQIENENRKTLLDYCTDNSNSLCNSF